MRKFNSGLHKDVASIFDGVWNPETDNIQPSFDVPTANSAAAVGGGRQIVNESPRESRLGGFLRAFKGAPGHAVRSRSRRERKRLTAISKHLMINMPG